jgi:hypothetical protein
MGVGVNTAPFPQRDKALIEFIRVEGRIRGANCELKQSNRVMLLDQYGFAGLRITTLTFCLERLDELCSKRQNDFRVVFSAHVFDFFPVHENLLPLQRYRIRAAKPSPSKQEE